jgi:hypothetical protein
MSLFFGKEENLSNTRIKRGLKLAPHTPTLPLFRVLLWKKREKWCTNIWVSYTKLDLRRTHDEVSWTPNAHKQVHANNNERTLLDLITLSLTDEMGLFGEKRWHLWILIRITVLFEPRNYHSKSHISLFLPFLWIPYFYLRVCTCVSVYIYVCQ